MKNLYTCWHFDHATYHPRIPFRFMVGSFYEIYGTSFDHFYIYLN
ncbi:hypothetical protein [Spirosoma flavus]